MCTGVTPWPWRGACAEEAGHTNSSELAWDRLLPHSERPGAEVPGVVYLCVHRGGKAARDRSWGARVCVQECVRCVSVWCLCVSQSV